MGWIFRLEPMLDQMNQRRRAQNREPLSWAQVGRLLGMSRQALQNLASNRELKATNTRFLESFCRFFDCGPAEMLALAPPPEPAPDHDEIDRLLALNRVLEQHERPNYHVEELYGARAARRWPRDRAAAEM